MGLAFVPAHGPYAFTERWHQMSLDSIAVTHCATMRYICTLKVNGSRHFIDSTI